uniref:Uncharacterized protein n=1 Tax=Pithovirus LCPAC404 TaxID=2506597 RepID=A0A481ZH83_9VIRU|nr:MAG: hypothetical protein LCPAC404_03150 [Pithovirus LCPAC404]
MSGIENISDYITLAFIYFKGCPDTIFYGLSSNPVGLYAAIRAHGDTFQCDKNNVLCGNETDHVFICKISKHYKPVYHYIDWNTGRWYNKYTIDKYRKYMGLKQLS